MAKKETSFIWSRDRHFSPSLPSGGERGRYLKAAKDQLRHESDACVEIPSLIVRYDALARFPLQTFSQRMRKWFGSLTRTIPKSVILLVTLHHVVYSYHTITPVCFDICPAIISVQKKQSQQKKRQHESFNFSSLLWNMEEKQTKWYQHGKAGHKSCCGEYKLPAVLTCMISKKANAGIGAMRHIRPFVSSNSLENVYKTLVKLYFKYCSSLCMGQLQKVIKW